jgi:hypothetical protein
MPADTFAPALSTYLPEFPYVAEPDVSGALAIFPLIGPMPGLEYLTFAQARPLGAKLIELEGGASVRDLTILNPTDLPVLLFEGEEVLGAQQNRTFDVSVLVAARSSLRVPVSCVEAGRWDGSRSRESFEPAPQAAYPSMRRMKNSQAREQLDLRGAPRADQNAVWDEVSAKAARHGAASRTGAMSDVFEHRRGLLDEMRSAISMKCSQTGMLVAIGGRFTVLDRVSQPDALDSLFGPLVAGYALDSLELQPVDPPSVEQARAMLERILACRVSEYDGIGLGRDARVAENGITGAGVLAASELVQLSVFIDVPGGESPTPRGARIGRPSRRRA